MQQDELLQEGLALMAMGMGFVFVFLTILVVTVTLMSALFTRFQPAPTAVARPSRARPASAPVDQGDETVAVITAAVHRYRASRTR